MKLYLAGLYSGRFELAGRVYNEKLDAREQEARRGVRHFLDSYHYIGNQSYADRIKMDGSRVFLDSGAFSAWTKQVEIDLPTYVDYIKHNHSIIEEVDGDLLASVLDGIGDPQKTYENQMKMESLGVRPLPCFHFGEDPRYLEWYIQNYTYITIGGMVGRAANVLESWLDMIWSKYLTRPDGWAKLKVHGFGLTNIKLMGKYPWYSVDSSSWAQYMVNGYIYPPKLGKSLMISSRKGSVKQEGDHFDNITPAQREYVRKLIEDDGFSADRMREEHYARGAYNMWAYTVLNDRINASLKPFHLPQMGLF